MKNKLLLMFFVAFISCNNKKSHSGKAIGAIPFTNEDFKEIKEIKGEVLLDISDSLLFSGTLSINDNKLLIDEIKTEKALHIIELPKERYIGKFVDKGRGPGEVLSIWPIIDSPKGKIRMLDNRSNKIVEYKIDSLILNKAYSKEYETGGIFMDGAAIINDRVYSLNHNSKESRLFITDDKGNIVSKKGKLPQFGGIAKDKMDPDFYWADMDFENNVLAISYRFLPVIQIFNSASQNWTTLSGPDFQISKTNYSDYTVYNNVQVTEKYIYALYNGKKFEGHDWQHTKTVYVFKLNGNISRKYELDTGIRNFTVYKDKILYGLSDGKEGQNLIKFQL